MRLGSDQSYRWRSMKRASWTMRARSGTSYHGIAHVDFTGGLTRSVVEKYGMGACKPVHTIGISPELSLEQPEESLLDHAGKQRYEVIT